MRTRGRTVLTKISTLLYCATALAATACAGGSARSQAGAIRIVVDKPLSMADEAVHITVQGLTPGEKVTLGLSTPDYGDTPWTSHADFVANAGGVVDLATAAPQAGSSYAGVDPMGLFWSITTTPTNPDRAIFTPLKPPADFSVRITATPEGGAAVTTTLTRRWTAPGVTVRPLTLAADQVVGQLYLPPATTAKKPGVVIWGGSEGGMSLGGAARLLAAHGYPALALAYWKEPGLPSELRDIPVEYFAAAGRLLAAQAGVDRAHIFAVGYSRGTEAALLAADDFPNVFHGVVLYAPSDESNGSFPSVGGAAWTLAGKAVPMGPIPVDHISGPVLALAGQDDKLWDSTTFGTDLMAELDKDGDRHAHTLEVYPNAGHVVGTYPYFPARTVGTLENGQPVDFGGTIAGDEAAQADGWARLLALLATPGS